MALARRIASNAPLAVRVSKEITRSTSDWTESEAWERQLALIDRVRLSEDAVEGARAFSEKRTPQWKGV
jgi:enoyl-CoA hydratase